MTPGGGTYLDLPDHGAVLADDGAAGLLVNAEPDFHLVGSVLALVVGLAACAVRGLVLPDH